MRVATVIISNSSKSILPLSEACLRFSPQLCIKRPETIFIEIGKCKKLYSEAFFKSSLLIILKKFKLDARIGVGNSIIESLVLTVHETLDKNLLKTDSFFEFLDPLKTNAKSEKFVDQLINVLAKLGVYTVKEFLSIPGSELASRFGSNGLLIRSRMTGESDVEWPLWIPEEEISEKIEFSYPNQCSSVEQTLFYMKPMLERLFYRLWGRRLRASSIKLELTLDRSSIFKKKNREWVIEFIIPQSSAKSAISIIREKSQSETRMKPLEASISNIYLKVLNSLKEYQCQRQLFEKKEEIEENFNSAFSQLIGILGKDKVFRAKIYEDSVVERSWSRDVKEQSKFPDLDDYIPVRPIKILRIPERVELSGDSIFIRQRRYQILKWSHV